MDSLVHTPHDSRWQHGRHREARRPRRVAPLTRVAQRGRKMVVMVSPHREPLLNFFLTGDFSTNPSYGRGLEKKRAPVRHDAGVGGAIGARILSFVQLCGPLATVRRARRSLGMGALALNNAGKKRAILP